MRIFGRSSGGLETLRALWRSGDAETRATVASRVNAWLGRDPSKRNGIIDRVTARERARFAPLRLAA